MTARQQDGGTDRSTGLAEARQPIAAGPGPDEADEGTDEILERLRLCLHAVRTTHDLGRKEMRVTERAIRQLDQHGMATTANEFWEATALPRAQLLVNESKRVIDRELTVLARLHGDTPHEVAIAALPSTAGINDLGSWWQRRLRRAAMMRSILAIATNTPARAEFLIANKEMALLDQAPWSHGDRLLSAFELAHGEIAKYGRRRASELFDQPTNEPEASDQVTDNVLIEANNR